MTDEGQNLGWRRLAAVVGLMALTVGVGLGGASRLTYHEAFVAQAARELIAAGDWLVPTIGGQPWLEKPPLLIWLVAGLSWGTGGVTAWSARVPSALAATAVALGVAVLAARRWGPTVGLLAGLIQATTAWTVLRGRLGEADILLAALVTGLMLVVDRLRTGANPGGSPTRPPPLRGPHRSPLARIPVTALIGQPPPLPVAEIPPAPTREPAWLPDLSQDPDAHLARWRWAFWGLLGATALVKGVGFGAALVLPALGALLVWDRDGAAVRRLVSLPGMVVAVVVALAWPVAVAVRHPAALSLWTMHVTDRLASHPEHFIGGPRWQYLPAVLLQALPWTPLALLGAGPSLVRARRERHGGDRLLWAWAVVPVLVLSAATVKNAHYAIHALPPWSIWAALGLVRVERIARRRAWWSPGRLRRLALALFGGLGLAVAAGYLVVAPRLDARGREWGHAEAIGRTLDPATPLVCLYEDWDRKPYPTPFGPVPHDWAIRLFSFGRAATWRQGVLDLEARPPAPPGQAFALLARDRDRAALTPLGQVEVISRGPAARFDRTFTLFRITPAGRWSEPFGGDAFGPRAGGQGLPAAGRGKVAPEPAPGPRGINGVH